MAPIQIALDIISKYKPLDMPINKELKKTISTKKSNEFR